MEILLYEDLKTKVQLTLLSCIKHPSSNPTYDATILFSICLPALCKAI